MTTTTEIAPYAAAVGAAAIFLATAGLFFATHRAMERTRRYARAAATPAAVLDDGHERRPHLGDFDGSIDRRHDRNQRSIEAKARRPKNKKARG